MRPTHPPIRSPPPPTSACDWPAPAPQQRSIRSALCLHWRGGRGHGLVGEARLAFWRVGVVVAVKDGFY